MFVLITHQKHVITTLLQHFIFWGVVDKGVFKQPNRSHDISMRVKDARLPLAYLFSNLQKQKLNAQSIIKLYAVYVVDVRTKIKQTKSDFSLMNENLTTQSKSAIQQ